MERMRRIMEDACASVLLIDRATADRALVLPEIEVINAEDNSLLSEDNNDPEVVVDPDSLRMLCTLRVPTGTPKGVGGNPPHVVSLAFDRCLERRKSGSSACFHSSLRSTRQPSKCGSAVAGKQVIIAPSRELDIAVLNRLLKEERYLSVPHQQLLQRLAQEAPGCFSAVCELWVGGDVFPLTQFSGCAIVAPTL